MRSRLRILLATACFTLLTLAASAQSPIAANLQRVQTLKPPAGARVAIVVFEDLQCPDCARAYPVVKQVAEAQKIPIVHYDFPLPMHNFAKPAAIYARFFDSKSAKLGDGFRAFIFHNQATVTPENLKAMVDKYAQDNGVAMPFLLDPGMRLEHKVDRDVALGKKIGIQHTPTIFVVGNTKTSAEPFVEVVDRSQLTQLVLTMKAVAK